MDCECSFSLFSLVVSPPSTMISVLLSFSRGQTSCWAHTPYRVASPSQVPTPGNFSLVLILVPPPQVLLHRDHGVQFDHWHPFIWTSPKKYYSFSEYCLRNVFTCIFTRCLQIINSISEICHHKVLRFQHFLLSLNCKFVLFVLLWYSSASKKLLNFQSLWYILLTFFFPLPCLSFHF